jgi:heme exporter protein B
VRAPARPEAGFVAKTLVLVGKDLRLETRARETVLPMTLFSITVALVLAFTLPEPERVEPKVVAGFVWVTILFAGLIGFARTFETEREDGAIDTLLLVPLDRSALFAAKALVNLTGIVVLEVIALPLFGLLFSLDLWSRGPSLAAVVLAADIGLVCVGTLFSALAAHTRSRELLLPVLALPALVPVFIAAVELSGDLFAGGALEEASARGWWAIIICFDVVSAAVGALTFEYVLE